MSIKDFKLTPSNLDFFTSELSKLLTVKGKALRVNVVEWRDKRSLSQNALFHVWVGELSEFLIKRGRKDASKEFCKDLLKHTFLGYEEKEMTDAVTGDKTVISSLKHTSKLDTGEMTWFMNLCYQWCLEIGLMLTIPEDSEYMKLKGVDDA